MKKIIVWLFIVLLAPLTSFAEEILTLDAAIEEILSANPDVAASRYKTDAARARILQEKALDDPMVGVMFENVPTSTVNVRRGEQINYRLEQKIPFPGKRFVRGKVARLDAEATGYTGEGRVGDVLLDLKKTYYEVYQLDRSLEVNRETQRLLRQLLGSAETAYATNQTSAAAPIKAQVELTKLKNEELQLGQQQTTHLSHLKALLNRSNHGEIRLPNGLQLPQLKPNLAKIYELAAEHRPELKALRAMEQRDRSRLTKARQGLIPDFSLGAEYNQRPGMEDAWTGTAMVNLPVFFWGKNRGELKEAKAELKATEAEHRSMEVHTVHEIDQAYSAVKTAEKLVGSYRRELLPQAKTNLAAARTAYAAGQVDFMMVIDAVRTYQELQRAFYENQAGLGMAFAELERLVGQNLGDL